jgi:hypothetical protein
MEVACCLLYMYEQQSVELLGPERSAYKFIFIKEVCVIDRLIRARFLFVFRCRIIS